MERAAGILKHKCATLREAEMLAQNGITDIVIAYQMVGPNINRFVSLQRQYPNADFKVIVDHTEAVSALSAEAAKFGLDCQSHARSGCRDEPNRDTCRRCCGRSLRAKFEAADGLQPWGLHVYDGHIHDEDVTERKASCDESLAQVAENAR